MLKYKAYTDLKDIVRAVMKESDQKAKKYIKNNIIPNLNLQATHEILNEHGIVVKIPEKSTNKNKWTVVSNKEIGIYEVGLSVHQKDIVDIGVKLLSGRIKDYIHRKYQLLYELNSDNRHINNIVTELLNQMMRKYGV